MPDTKYFRPLDLSDADRYRWIRANRGNFAIDGALRGSDRDEIFDAKIEAAMRMAAAGRRYYASQPIRSQAPHREAQDHKMQARLMAVLSLGD